MSAFHLLSIDSLSDQQIEHIFSAATDYYTHQLQTSGHPLQGKTVVILFFENSTRTTTSFEVSAKRLGADVVVVPVDRSAITKGESLLDTALTIDAMRPAVIIVRHQASGAVKLVSERVQSAVINAGDGTHEHPTQALLDALAIRLHKKAFSGLRVSICGDILHSRVARSNMKLLARLGAEVHVVAPPTLMPADIEQYGVVPHCDMREGLQDADVVMMLRVQQERMQGQFFPSVREYFHFYGLDEDTLSHAKGDAIVMHPGPMNRGLEIDSRIADDLGRSVVQQQVALGVAVRMACLELVTEGSSSFIPSDATSNHLDGTNTLLKKAAPKISILRGGANHG